MSNVDRKDFTNLGTWSGKAPIISRRHALVVIGTTVAAALSGCNLVANPHTPNNPTRNELMPSSTPSLTPTSTPNLEQNANAVQREIEINYESPIQNEEKPSDWPNNIVDIPGMKWKRLGPGNATEVVQSVYPGGIESHENWSNPITRDGALRTIYIVNGHTPEVFDSNEDGSKNPNQDKLYYPSDYLRKNSGFEGYLQTKSQLVERTGGQTSLTIVDPVKTWNFENLSGDSYFETTIVNIDGTPNLDQYKAQNIAKIYKCRAPKDFKFNQTAAGDHQTNEVLVNNSGELIEDEPVYIVQVINSHGEVTNQIIIRVACGNYGITQNQGNLTQPTEGPTPQSSNTPGVEETPTSPAETNTPGPTQEASNTPHSTATPEATQPPATNTVVPTHEATQPPHATSTSVPPTSVPPTEAPPTREATQPAPPTNES